MLVFVLGNYFDQWFICVLWRLMSPAPTTPVVIYGHKRPLILPFAPSLMMGIGQYAVGFGGIRCLEAVGVKVMGRPKIWRKGLHQPPRQDNRNRQGRKEEAGCL